MKDFEDAIQLFSAIRAEADCLLTRNIRDYPSDEIPIQTPGDFIATHFPEVQ